MKNKILDNHLVVLDWVQLLAYFSFRKLEKNKSYRKITFSEINDFQLTLISVIRHKKLHLQVQYFYETLNSDMFDSHVSEGGYSGFRVKNYITVEQIFDKYLCNIPDDVLKILDESFDRYERIFN